MDVFAEVKALVRGGVEALAAEGRLPAGLDLGAVTVEPPRDPGHGDMATNAAMVLARPARMARATSPRRWRRSSRARRGWSRPRWRGRDS